MEVTESRGCGVARLWGSWRELCPGSLRQSGYLCSERPERLGLSVRTGLRLVETRMRLRGPLLIFFLPPSPLYKTYSGLRTVLIRRLCSVVSCVIKVEVAER